MAGASHILALSLSHGGPMRGGGLPEYLVVRLSQEHAALC